MDGELGVHADLTTQQRLRSYRGCAKIEIRYLTFEEQGTLGSKPFDQKNVERLQAIFDEVGCQPLEPDHRIAAVISEEILRSSLELSQIAGAELMDNTNPPSLRLADNTHLLCLYGKHRVTAGQSFGEIWWLVDLYLDDISLEVKAQLREESPDAQGFKEGDVFRIYRQYKRQNNHPQAKKWYMRFQSDERRKIVRRLEQNETLCAAFDDLLPFIGLWDPVNMSQIKCVLGLRCHEYVCHYLYKIKGIWSRLFCPKESGLLDAYSLRLIEGRMPVYSHEDRTYVSELLDSGLLFPLLPENRRESLQEILQVPGRILSIHTLALDARYLEPPAKVFRRLFPLRKRDTVKSALTRHFNSMGMGHKYEMQISEYEYGPAPPLVNPVSTGILQLWLYALRHFIHPRKDRTEERPALELTKEDLFALREMAMLAHRLRFSSHKSREALKVEHRRSTYLNTLRVVCDEKFYLQRDSMIKQVARSLEAGIENLSRVKATPADPPCFTTDQPNMKTRRRFSAPSQKEHRHDRSGLFIDKIYSSDQPASQYPTSLAITRDIIFAFFGKEPLYSTFMNGPRAVERTDESMCSPATSTRHLEEESGPNQGNSVEAGNSPNPPNVEPISESMHQAIPSSDEEEAGLDPDTDLQPHPPGSPPPVADGSNMIVEPWAPGFEDYIAPMGSKVEICLHRKARDILRLWYEHETKLVIVLFLFESRCYYKFHHIGGDDLRVTLQNLSKDHYFLCRTGFDLHSVDISAVYDEAVRHQLILVGRLDGALRDVEEDNGRISIDKIKDYMQNFDVRTGKRRIDADVSRAAKRSR